MYSLRSPSKAYVASCVNVIVCTTGTHADRFPKFTMLGSTLSAPIWSASPAAVPDTANLFVPRLGSAPRRGGDDGGAPGGGGGGGGGTTGPALPPRFILGAALSLLRATRFLLLFLDFFLPCTIPPCGPIRAARTRKKANTTNSLRPPIVR